MVEVPDRMAAPIPSGHSGMRIGCCAEGGCGIFLLKEVAKNFWLKEVAVRVEGGC